MALITTIPPFTAVCGFMFIPEYSRWLLASGSEWKAKDVCRQIAKRNGVVLGDITVTPEKVCSRVCVLLFLQWGYQDVCCL